MNSSFQAETLHRIHSALESTQVAAAQVSVLLKLLPAVVESVSFSAYLVRHTNGLIVVVPDPAVGPQVAKIAKDAKVPLLTSDDQICTDLPDPSVCAHQNLLPRVGFSSDQLGTQVGQRAAQEFTGSGWSAADTQIVAAWQPDVNVCRERVAAADAPPGASC